MTPPPHQSPTTTTLTSTGDEIIVNIFSAITPPPSPPICLPCNTLPPLIYHITVPHGVSSTTTPYTLLTHDLQLPETLITQIVDMGGFYLHTPYPRCSPRARRETVSVLHSELPVGKRVYMRLHIHPKRYLGRAYGIIGEEDGVLCVYKPAELPVCAGVDNVKECLTSLIGGFVTTRIDVGTSGVVFLTRERELVKQVNACLQHGKKYYIVFCEFRGFKESLTECTWRDWYRAKPELGRGKRGCILRRFEDGECEGWVEARLEIVGWRCMRFAEGRGRVVIVRLCTGRTHQIRVQMAARGYWVVGDGKYENVVSNGGVYEEGVIGGDAPRLGLHCWLVFCTRWWLAELSRRTDLVKLVEHDAAFWDWLNVIETSLRDGQH